MYGTLPAAEWSDPYLHMLMYFDGAVLNDEQRQT